MIVSTKDLSDELLIQKNPEVFQLAKEFWFRYKNEIFHDGNNTYLRKSNSIDE